MLLNFFIYLNVLLLTLILGFFFFIISTVLFSFWESYKQEQAQEAQEKKLKKQMTQEKISASKQQISRDNKLMKFGAQQFENNTEAKNKDQ